MSHQSQQYPISRNLFDLTESQIALLDQEVTGGEGWACYCNGYITLTTVFENKISGRFRDFLADHIVEVRVDDRQITTFCSTCRSGEICLHSVALLYSWIYDSEGFINLGDSLKHLESMNKGDLVEIIGRMLINNPTNLEYVNDSHEEEDDFDMDGYLN